jgi:hypothetical protein
MFGWHLFWPHIVACLLAPFIGLGRRYSATIWSRRGNAEGDTV